MSDHCAERGRRRGLLAALLALAAALPVSADTFYVRTDGGTPSQCNGRADQPAGSGVGRDCAWQHPFFALPPGGRARINGGDTLIIGPGSYMIGLGAPGSKGACYAEASYECQAAAIPSGPSATRRTRVLGKGHDAGCPTPPRLWGSERVGAVIDLTGSSNIELGCLEITDESDCVEFHSNPAIRCQRDQAPFGRWAATGIIASDSRNAWLHDLDIHGLANRGILAGGLTDWTVERVKIIANGWAGWDGDIGKHSSNSGAIVLRDVEIAWNGCGQRRQSGLTHGCWAQQGGGYGDGLGTASTGGRWLIEDSRIHHNTSDGIDLLYLDGAAGTSVTLRRVYAAANAGNQVKTRGSALIENSVIIGSCFYFDGRDDMQDGDQCRALGNALSVGLVAGQSATIRHNTLTGEGDCLILTGGGNALSRVLIQDNVLVGQYDTRANRQGNPGEWSCGHYADESPARVEFAGNVFWRLKGFPCPSGNTCLRDPRLTDMGLGNFDARPLPGSPVIDRATRGDPGDRDFFGHPRVSGAAADVGAVELPAPARR